MIILYTGDRHFSSWSMRAAVMAAEKGISLQERQVTLDWPLLELADGTRTVSDEDPAREPCAGCACLGPDLAEFDLEGLLRGAVAARLPRVPILVDTTTEAVASDVLAIGEYLDERFPSPRWPALLPADPATRAAVRSLCAHVHCDLAELLHGASYARSLWPTDRPPIRPPATPAALEQARWLAETLEQLLTRSLGPFLFGAFGLPDAMLAPVAQQFAGWQLDAGPATRAYFDALLDRPSVRAHLEDAREPYRRLAEADPGSPEWIVRHYRFHSDARLLHDWRTDTCHELPAVSGQRAVELAYQGLDLDRIGQRIADEFEAPLPQVRSDLAQLFAALIPSYAQLIPNSQEGRDASLTIG